MSLIKDSDQDNLETILDFAIVREQRAYDFYMDLAEKSELPGVKELFVQFAREELGHKRKLEGIKEGTKQMSPPQKVLDLKIADYLVDVDTDEDLDFRKALILAMKREKSSFRLYIDLANSISDKNLKPIFLSLAHEEAKHKLRFEVEYDSHFLAEN